MVTRTEAQRTSMRWPPVQECPRAQRCSACNGGHPQGRDARPAARPSRVQPPRPPPSQSTGLKIDIIRFQRGSEANGSSVMTSGMLRGCFSPALALLRWASRRHFRTRSGRAACPGHGRQQWPLARGFLLFIPLSPAPHPLSCCLQPLLPCPQLRPSPAGTGWVLGRWSPMLCRDFPFASTQAAGS